MNGEPVAPRRRVRAEINAHADDPDALANALHDLADVLCDNDIVFGQPMRGGSKHDDYTCTVTIDAAMTAQRYREEMQAFHDRPVVTGTTRGVPDDDR